MMTSSASAPVLRSRPQVDERLERTTYAPMELKRVSVGNRSSRRRPLPLRPCCIASDVALARTLSAPPSSRRRGTERGTSAVSPLGGHWVEDSETIAGPWLPWLSRRTPNGCLLCAQGD